MTITSEAIDRIRAAGDSPAVLRAALEAGLEAVGSRRGLVALAERGSGRLYAAAGIGVSEAQPYELRPMLFGAAQDHPLVVAVRDGVSVYLGRADLARRSLASLRRTGLQQVAVVPLPGEIVASPCLLAGRCLSQRCPLRQEQTPSADEGWAQRIAAGCVKATVSRSRGALLLDTPAAPDAAQQRTLEEIALAASAALRRYPDFAIVPAETPADELEEEWVRRCFAAVDDPVLVADMRGNFVFANARARSLFVAYTGDSEGRRRAVNLNRMLLDAWLASHLARPGAMAQLELSLVDPAEGSELLFELLPSTAYNTVAKETGVVIVLKDVSDIRRVVDELESTVRTVHAQAQDVRAERDQLSLVLQSIGQPIIVADPVANLLRLNEAATRLLQPQAAPSAHERELARRNNAIITSVLSKAGIGRHETSVDVTLHNPASGEARVYAARAAVARDHMGAPAAIVLALSDLTELRELERRRLERQLFESEKLAATGRLAASIAHEINNPLEAMTNALYVLAAQLPDEDPKQRFVEIARNETQRISRIVRQLLGFYRPSVLRVPTDLNLIVTEVVELLRAQMRKNGVRYETSLAASLPPIIAAPDQLKQVFLNLMLNGIQAMPKGGDLSIATRLGGDGHGDADVHRLVGGTFVVFEVRDSGGGMSPEVRARLFEPFFTTKEKSGTGLGLWVCQEVVQAHGGSIRVDSDPGVGSTFTVALPFGGGANPS